MNILGQEHAFVADENGNVIYEVIPYVHPFKTVNIPTAVRLNEENLVRVKYETGTP